MSEQIRSQIRPLRVGWRTFVYRGRHRRPTFRARRAGAAVLDYLAK